MRGHTAIWTGPGYEADQVPLIFPLEIRYERSNHMFSVQTRTELRHIIEDLLADSDGELSLNDQASADNAVVRIESLMTHTLDFPVEESAPSPGPPPLPDFGDNDYGPRDSQVITTGHGPIVIRTHDGTVIEVPQ